jgi:hypothetical protein
LGKETYPLRFRCELRLGGNPVESRADSQKEATKLHVRDSLAVVNPVRALQWAIELVVQQEEGVVQGEPNALVVERCVLLAGVLRGSKRYAGYGFLEQIGKG